MTTTRNNYESALAGVIAATKQARLQKAEQVVVQVAM